MSIDIENIKDIENEEWKSILRKIIIITKQLIVLRTAILFLFFLSVLFSIIFSLSKSIQVLKYLEISFSLDLVSFFLFNIIMPTIGIILLFFYNSRIKDGENYYDEISDDMEWGNRRNRKLSKRYPLQTRKIFKSFLQASDLPFVSNNGNFFYVIIFLILLIGNLLIGLNIFTPLL